MTGRYALGTSVSVEKSITELRQLVARYGVTECGIFTSETGGTVMFTMKGRVVKIAVKMPTREETMRDKAGRYMRFSQKRYDQRIQERWRALILLVKARLEMIELGLETIEQAFMPYLLLPDGKTTVGEAVIGQIEGGQLPLMLGSGQ